MVMLQVMRSYAHHGIAFTNTGSNFWVVVVQTENKRIVSILWTVPSRVVDCQDRPDMLGCVRIIELCWPAAQIQCRLAGELAQVILEEDLHATVCPIPSRRSVESVPYDTSKD